MIDNILTPTEINDFELIYCIFQAMNNKKEELENHLKLIISSEGEYSHSVMLNGLIDEETEQVFLLDELPPERYNEEYDYNTSCII
mmetsp:Transcript_10211/g.9019  ORF Transcript_10211/g.9019 Transcript_10211/m.9019 type:complete len:86 (+) Transcript_10211:422-679(+)